MSSSNTGKQDMRGHLSVVGIPAAILLAVLFITLCYVKPAVTKEVYLLAGASGTTSYEYGTQYAAFFREHGITVHIVETAGLFDNLNRLVSGEKHSVGFVLSGAERMLEEHKEENKDVGSLVSLGSLYFEPLWLFTGKDVVVTRVADLEKKKVALGPKGSGSYAVAGLLLRANGIDMQAITGAAEKPAPDEAAEALMAGEIDAAFFMGESTLPVIARLLESEAVKPLSFEQAGAYASMYPELTELVMPAGAFDLARDIPGRDIRLIAPAANLVMRKGEQPAIVDLLLDSAKSIHRKPSPFSGREAFPSMDHVSLPISPAAIRYYEQGPSFLRRILPFRVATFLDRFLIVIVPVLTVALTLFKSVPALIRMRFSIQIQGLYRRLEAVEKSLRENADRQLLVKKLDDLERVSAKMRVPRSNIAQYFEFRQNIHAARERVTDLH